MGDNFTIGRIEFCKEPFPYIALEENTFPTKFRNELPVIVKCFKCGKDIEGFQKDGELFGFIEIDEGYTCFACYQNILKTDDTFVPAEAPPVSPLDAPDRDIDFLLGIAEECGDIVVLDDFNEALIGIGGSNGEERAVYDTNLIIRMLMDRDGMIYEDARDYFHNNIAKNNAGPKTPIFVDYTDLGCLKPCRCNGRGCK